MILGIILLVVIGIVSSYFLFPSFYGPFSIAKNRTSTGIEGETTAGAHKIAIPLKKVVVNVGAANVRTAPGMNSQRIGVISKGEPLNVLAEQTTEGDRTWYKIILYEGREGWIASTVVQSQ
jgi:uncharacterized protein YgiM (DUF1202 family)